MIHLVTAANQHLYARQLGEMGRIEWASDDPRAAWLMALGPAEELRGHLWIRPVADASETWEASRLWSDATEGDAHAGRHRLLAAACEFVLSRGGRRMRMDIGVQDYAWLTDGILAFEICAPPVAQANGVKLGLTCEIARDALDRMYGALREIFPLIYLVEDEDMAIYGSIAHVQQEADCARQVDAAAATVDRAAPDQARARIKASFARWDARSAEIQPAPRSARAIRR